MARNESNEPRADQGDAPEKRRGCLAGAFRRLALAGLLALALVFLLGLALNMGKGRMKGMNLVSSVYAVPATDVELLFDLTGVDSSGERICEHRIFDRLLELIGAADSVVILDMFLVNRFRGSLGDEFHRDTSAELVQALVERKRENPDLFILFVTDPINAFYRDECPPILKPLADAGGCVVLTDLLQLSDSNWLYSPFYRVLRLLGPVAVFGRIGVVPNPFDAESGRFNLFQFSRLMNFKANHRKVAVVDTADGGWVSLVTSANPHSGSSAHGNVALVVRNGPSRVVAGSELDIARASILRRPQLAFGGMNAMELLRRLEQLGKRLDSESAPAGVDSATAEGGIDSEASVLLQYVTERAIFDKILWLLDDAGQGDRVDVAMFYLSDSEVVDGLKRAVARGAELRLLLDPNKDAFGRRKNGIPNRAVAADLVEWGAQTGHPLTVRWFGTHGEQAHFKLLHVRSVDAGRSRIVVGSANFTPRNLRGRNLESAFYLETRGAPGGKCEMVFNRLWRNLGLDFSVAYDVYASKGFKLKVQKMMTAFGDATGFCTW